MQAVYLSKADNERDIKSAKYRGSTSVTKVRKYRQLWLSKGRPGEVDERGNVSPGYTVSCKLSY
jgi:hypothetical protein